jgi:UDP-N-acetyl-D-galactosamine dehydrogenase
MIASGSSIKGARVNVLGLTFKEDCPDLRNSRVIDIISELKTYGVEVFVHDPSADSGEAEHEYGIPLTPWESLPQADAVVLAVAHQEYRRLKPSDLAGRLKTGGGVVDVKAVLGPDEIRAAGYGFWRL